MTDAQANEKSTPTPANYSGIKAVDTESNIMQVDLDSFADVNKKKIHEMMKLLKINTNTQDGASFRDLTNFEYEGSYKQAFVNQKIKQVNRDAKILNENSTQNQSDIAGDAVRYSTATNLLGYKAVKKINKMYKSKD
jgi:hypothetical protein